MGVVDTTYTFNSTDTITSSKLNNIVDDTFFTSTAISGSTLQVVSPGKLAVAAGGITANELASGSVTTTKITDSNVTVAKLESSLDLSSKTVILPDNSVAPEKLTQKITLGTAQASTSGTSIDFTGIPSWAKKITVMFNEVSTSGTSNLIIRVGSGSFDTTGYTSTTQVTVGSGVAVISATSGFGVIQIQTNSNTMTGAATLSLFGSNTWVQHGIVKAATNTISFSAGVKSISGYLDRVRITTINGTDLFDAGSINIMYE